MQTVQQSDAAQHNQEALAQVVNEHGPMVSNLHADLQSIQAELRQRSDVSDVASSVGSDIAADMPEWRNFE